MVTGGTGGLGTTVVERLSRDYRCILLAREPGGESSIQADLGDESSVRAAVAAAVAQFGAPYGLVHMAGGFAGGALSQTTTEVWQSLVGLNLTSSFFVIRETMKVMKRDAPGRIVAISSIATLSRSAGAAAYQISKGGLNTLIQLAAAELARTPITANALLPDTLGAFRWHRWPRRSPFCFPTMPRISAARSFRSRHENQQGICRRNRRPRRDAAGLVRSMGVAGLACVHRAPPVLPAGRLR
jgi:NAD(P)-dependent dehydrogenase (short-subunit alcohol dehydrogenase family)